MRAVLVSVLKAICGLTLVARANGFLSQRNGKATHRIQLSHPFQHYPYSNRSFSLEAKKKKSCAVLVDAENTPYESLSFVLDKLNDMGYNPQVREAYGDWKKASLKSYAFINRHHSFTTIYSCTSDSDMIIGAMDILHERPEIECFALVTSNSDLRSLIIRLTQAGKMTVGFGNQQTPKLFANKYKEFVFLEEPIFPKEAPTELPEKEKLVEFLSKIIWQKSNARGWVSLSALGKEFDYRKYGYKTMSKYFDDHTDCFQLNASRELVRIQVPKDRLNYLGDLIASSHDEDNWAPVKELEAMFDARLYGYDDMKNLLDEFPELFVQATDINSATFVRNQIPKKYIQEVKKVVESKRCFHGWSWYRDIEPHFKKVDWRRFGYENLEDLLKHQSDHFLVDGSYMGSMKCMIRPS